MHTSTAIHLPLLFHQTLRVLFTLCTETNVHSEWKKNIFQLILKEKWKTKEMWRCWDVQSKEKNKSVNVCRSVKHKRQASQEKMREWESSVCVCLRETRRARERIMHPKIVSWGMRGMLRSLSLHSHSLSQSLCQSLSLRDLLGWNRRKWSKNTREEEETREEEKRTFRCSSCRRVASSTCSSRLSS